MTETGVPLPARPLGSAPCWRKGAWSKGPRVQGSKAAQGTLGADSSAGSCPSSPHHLMSSLISCQAGLNSPLPLP